MIGSENKSDLKLRNRLKKTESDSMVFKSNRQIINIYQETVKK